MHKFRDTTGVTCRHYVMDVLASPFIFKAQRLLFVQINTKDRANFSLSVLTFRASVFVTLLHAS